jgi:hypothetical protein
MRVLDETVCFSMSNSWSTSRDQLEKHNYTITPFALGCQGLLDPCAASLRKATSQVSRLHPIPHAHSSFVMLY